MKCACSLLVIASLIGWAVAADGTDDPFAAAAAPERPAAAARAEDEGQPGPDAVTTAGQIDEVTVYRDQALVTRRVEVPGPKGLREVVVTSLPENVLPESIFAESGDESVSVRSVRYRIRPVLQDVREEVRKLDEKIRAVQDKLQANNSNEQLTSQHKQYLDKLEAFTAPTAMVELTKGVLNAETLKALSEFLLDQRQKMTDLRLQLTAEQRNLNEQLNLLQRERDVLTGGSAKTIREAIVFVDLKGEAGELRLRYVVNAASWSPSYNVRSGAKRDGITLEYNAAIHQMSGEDWNDVKMTLSTATPSLAATAPELDPLTIAVGSLPGEQQSQSAPGDYQEAKKNLFEQQRQLDKARAQNTFRAEVNSAGGMHANGRAQQAAGQTQREFDERLNSLAGELQVLDLVVQGKVSKTSHAPSNNEGVSVNYALGMRTSLPSRADRQLIQIAAMPMKAEFYKVAIPVLTSYVYEEAAVMNESDHVLLPGPVTTYVDGQFVGRGELPLVAVGESFTAGFGIDSSLRAKRELAEKTETIQGGNRLVDFTYKLQIENFGPSEAVIRLVDRLPTAKDSDVKLTLVSSGPELSTDERYQSERKKGILRWEVKVPAQAIGPKAYTAEYKLQMEYDKQLSITGLPIAHR